jgi:hypothetical protein
MVRLFLPVGVDERVWYPSGSETGPDVAGCVRTQSGRPVLMVALLIGRVTMSGDKAVCALTQSPHR